MISPVQAALGKELKIWTVRPPPARLPGAHGMQCPRCQHENSPTAKFCPKCAHPVAVTAGTQPLYASPETYTPRHLAEKILTSKTALEGERKQVTVLFADMKGSLELLADRDPEEARKLRDEVVSRSRTGRPVLFYTGKREGELLGLHLEDIDWRRNLIDLRRTAAFRSHRVIVNTPKSGKLRTVDAPGSLAALRDRYSVRQTEAAVAGVALSPWAFPSATDPAKPLNDAWLRDRVWRQLLDKAGVRHVRVHDARHTYAPLMLRRGVPIVYVSQPARPLASPWTSRATSSPVPTVLGVTPAMKPRSRSLSFSQADSPWLPDEITCRPRRRPPR